MKLRDDQARLQGLITETITLLCKNGLHFKKGFIVDALIGITTDDNETFLVKLEETVGNVGDVEDLGREYDEDVVIDRRTVRASRKRRMKAGTDSTPTKRQRSNVYDDYNGDDHHIDDYNDDNGMDNMKGNQDGGDLKREPSDGDTQDVGQSEAYDAVPDDGSSSTWNQSSINDHNDASGSQQVRHEVLLYVSTGAYQKYSVLRGYLQVRDLDKLYV